MSRNYKEEDSKDIDIKRKTFIENNSRKDLPSSVFSKSGSTKCNVDNNQSLSSESNSKSHWIPDFKPRDKVEAVQNCTQLDRKFIDSTILTVASMLLQTEIFLSLEKGSETVLWNCGGKYCFNIYF